MDTAARRPVAEVPRVGQEIAVRIRRAGSVERDGDVAPRRVRPAGIRDRGWLIRNAAMTLVAWSMVTVQTVVPWQPVHPTKTRSLARRRGQGGPGRRRGGASYTPSRAGPSARRTPQSGETSTRPMAPSVPRPDAQRLRAAEERAHVLRLVHRHRARRRRARAQRRGPADEHRVRPPKASMLHRRADPVQVRAHLGRARRFVQSTSGGLMCTDPDAALVALQHDGE